MFDWEEVIRAETEKPFMATFLTANNKPYPYAILPFERRLSQQFRNAVADALMWMLEEELQDANVLLLPEAKAFLLTTFADRTGLTVVPIRKRDYKLPQQIVVEQDKAYQGGAKMFCVGLEKDDKPLLVEDMISSGGTAIAVERAMRHHGFPLVGIGSVYERESGVRNIFEMTGYRAKAAARLKIIENMPRITAFYQR